MWVSLQRDLNVKGLFPLTEFRAVIGLWKMNILGIVDAFNTWLSGFQFVVSAFSLSLSI